jgi:hypothetical protein
MTQDQILKKGVILHANKVDFPDKPSISTASKEFIQNCCQYFQDERYDIKQAYEAALKL